MGEKVSYKQIWEVIQLLDKCCAGDVIASFSIDDLRGINTLVKSYSENYAGQIEGAFEQIKLAGDDVLTRKKKIGEWITKSKSVCAMKLSIALNGKENEEIPEVVEILEFYLDAELSDSVKALGLYNTAATFASRDAELCYELQTKAFELYPELATVFGIDYVYEPQLIKDRYFDICPICGGEEAHGHYCVPQFVGLKKGSCLAPVKLWKKCHDCDNLYAYNFPVTEMGEMNGHYTKKSTYSVIEPRYGLRVYSDIFNKCKQYTSGNKYLEIGIGGGEMIAAAMEMGYDVDAVEICKEDCEKVSSVLGIDIKWCDFVQYENDKAYDLIIMGDVLEHVSEPITALKKAVSMLNTGGVLWLSTPNYNSGFTRLKKFTDAMWNQKNHFTYFSYETLLPFLEEVGLEVKRYDISNRFNGSMELYCVKK